MTYNTEEIENMECPTPVNNFTAFKGSFPITNEQDGKRNNADLMAWQYDDINCVIPCKIDGKQLDAIEAIKQAIMNGPNSYPQFSTSLESMAWAYKKNNSVNEDGTVS